MSQSDLPPRRYRPEVEALQIWGTALVILVAALLPAWIVWLVWGWSRGFF